MACRRRLQGSQVAWSACPYCLGSVAAFPVILPQAWAPFMTQALLPRLHLQISTTYCSGPS